ncbi:hypothetical protein D3C78_1179090 [compost metagenome]
MQQRQGKGDVFGLDRRAVAVEQVRAQLDGIHPVIRADLPGLRQPCDGFTLAVQANQPGEDHVGDVLIPTVGEQIRVKVALWLENTGHHGVFTQFGGIRYQAGVGGRSDPFRQRFRLRTQ